MHRINLSWLVRLRWWVLACQALVIGAVLFGLGWKLPLVELGVILGVQALLNLLVVWRLAAAAAVSERVTAATLLIDVLCFTALAP